MEEFKGSILYNTIFGKGLRNPPCLSVGFSAYVKLSNSKIIFKSYFVNQKNPKSQFSRKESYRATGLIFGQWIKLLTMQITVSLKQSDEERRTSL
jgi:hypothetical protein